jgi:hypothetical protein
MAGYDDDATENLDVQQERPMKRAVSLFLLVVACGTALSARIDFTSTWKWMDAGTISFA